MIDRHADDYIAGVQLKPAARKHDSPVQDPGTKSSRTGHAQMTLRFGQGMRIPSVAALPRPLLPTLHAPPV